MLYVPLNSYGHVGTVSSPNLFCSCIQLYVLLRPYLYFISFLYLDLYVLGDDASISTESFKETK